MVMKPFLLRQHSSLIVENVLDPGFSAELTKNCFSSAILVTRWVKRYEDCSGVDRARTAEDRFILRTIEDLDIHAFICVMTCIARVIGK